MSWLSLKIFNVLLWLLLEPSAKIFLYALFVTAALLAVATCALVVAVGKMSSDESRDT